MNDPQLHESEQHPVEPVEPRLAPPTSPLDVHVAPEPPSQSNGLGVAAFVLSLAGFCIPVVPSLLGLACGVIAVRREPRGFAVAGIVLSVATGCGGTALLAMVASPMLALLWGGMPIAFNAAMDHAVALSLSAEVDVFRRERGRLPNDLRELPSGPSILAQSPNPLRIEFGTFTRDDPFDPASPGPIDVDYRIVSAGDDGAFGTPDDVVVLGLPFGDAEPTRDETEPMEDLRSP